MPRPMSSLRPTLKGKFPNGLGWHAQLRQLHRGRLTFSNDFLEYDANPHNQPRRQFVARYEDELSI